MIVKNETWSIEHLVLICNKIRKPKFQRDARWKVLPCNDTTTKIPNYQEYIQYLIDYKNNVTPITLATEIVDGEEQYLAIDGNNRINAILTFLNKPSFVFPHFFIEIETFIKSIKTKKEKEEEETEEKEKEDKEEDIKTCLIDQIKNLTYDQIHNCPNRLKKMSNFEKYPAYFDEGDYENIEDNIFKLFDKVRFRETKCNYVYFKKDIDIQINKISNGTIDDYNKLYERSNKYTSNFSINDALASILFNVKIDDEIKNQNIFPHVLNQIQIFYNNRYNENSKNEVLRQYEFITEDLNIFDYFIGLQNYLADKYTYTIRPFDLKGKTDPHIIKLYKLYNNIDCISPNSFNTKMVIKFSKSIEFALQPVQEAIKELFLLNTNEYFNKSFIGKKIASSIKENSLTYLLIANTEYIESKKGTDNKLIKHNMYLIAYHILCNRTYLSEEDSITYNNHNKIAFEPGGLILKQKCIALKKVDKLNQFFECNSSYMKAMLQEINKTHVKRNTFKIDNKKRRRTLNTFDMILLSNYWSTQQPNCNLRNKFETEHMSPFSSKFEGELAICRVGNLLPIPKTLNEKRGNKHIKEYEEIDSTYVKSMHDILCIDTYDKYMKHEGKNVIIYDNEEYNKKCDENEQLYINKFVENCCC